MVFIVVLRIFANCLTDSNFCCFILKYSHRKIICKIFRAKLAQNVVQVYIYIMIHAAEKQTKVINGKVQTLYIFSWPVGYTELQKQNWLTSNGWDEREAYKIAFNISEIEMKRIEND